MKPKYVIRFLFDAGSGICFWGANEATRARFGNYPIPTEALPLSAPTIAEANELFAWYDRSVNWDNPPEAMPWSRDERERFNRAVRQLVDAVRSELGDEFEMVDEQVES